MKDIVVIGGGTGTYTALMGLKKYTDRITAIVSMADSGGSSGILRDEFGILPPGDVRKCLLAMSEDSNMLRRLFEYRFNGISEKHSLGNLILAALEKITGDTASAIKEASRILNIKGKVLPVTLDSSHLFARLEDGTVISGETNIDIPKHNPKLRIEKLWLEPEAAIYAEAEEAIRDAGLIILGPGDLYTSLLPNFIVEGVSDSIRESKAKKAYICNIMTKHGETNNFKASDFLKELEKYLKLGVDFVILNTKRPDKEHMRLYGREKSIFVEPDLESNKERKVIKSDLMCETQFLRHDPDKLARVIIGLGNLKINNHQ